MASCIERVETELRHLTQGPSENEQPPAGMTGRLFVNCAGDSEIVLNKAKTLLICVDRAVISGWPDDGTWFHILPRWFVTRCGPERTQKEAEEELERWRSLSREEQLKVHKEQPWPVTNWLYWFRPENREWYWWDDNIQDLSTCIVTVEVTDWPFSWEAFAWMLRASGATEIISE